MKKFIMIAVTLFMVTSVFAQEIVEVVKVEWDTRNKGAYLGPYSDSRVYLSNGQFLKYICDKNMLGKITCSEWRLYGKDKRCLGEVDFPVTLGDKNLVGQKFENKYYVFTRINQNKQKVATYTIKKVSVHEVTSEFTASMNGDFSYKWANFIINKGEAKGSISGSAKGGMRTIVNIFFDNGKYATIEASSDPIWLDAEPGMQVEHYRIGDKNFYNLL